ncbi:protein ASPARTIC PROTEASE IN GUARD CELL 1-like protein [Carex littledalei]|uniref:Protein ASPARTIC PROTEASE IN GUARD CELL 1-like protein n=1 Tax=Carex littledalei TaxID=544730 RepID=A0A833R8Y1_9POAL|nr:protein ASPARTIC PROTEASE IN GUARD CELL 1-like protein [Carex littledalei]
MWLVLPFVFSLLLLNVASVKDISTPKCTSEINDEKQQLNSSGLYLTLYHPRSPCSPAPLPSLPFSTIFAHDNSRVASLEARLSKNSSTRSGSSKLKEDQAQVPLSPGTSVQVGNYVTRIGLGTPASSYIMIVDTGSSFCWLQCMPCIIECHRQVDPIFNPESSSTYYKVPCTASECSALESATLNPSECSNKSNVCIYQASYGDGSFSDGYLSRDTLSFAGSSFPNFIYGCGQDNEGLFGLSAGLIGLARNKLSLLYQLAPSLGKTFSYCLPSTSSSGYLSIGSSKPGQYSYTPLLSNSLADSLYFLKLSSISVSSQPIGVSSSSYTSIPTIIDSGTVISRLPSDVYTALSKAGGSCYGRDSKSTGLFDFRYLLFRQCFKFEGASSESDFPRRCHDKAPGNECTHRCNWLNDMPGICVGY